jgi:hypothetical protein
MAALVDSAWNAGSLFRYSRWDSVCTRSSMTGPDRRYALGVISKSVSVLHVGAAKPLHVGASSLLGNPSLAGRLRRTRGTSWWWRRGDRCGQDVDESTLGCLAVPQL